MTEFLAAFEGGHHGSGILRLVSAGRAVRYGYFQADDEAFDSPEAMRASGARLLLCG
jgi:hypothetical protein